MNVLLSNDIGAGISIFTFKIEYNLDKLNEYLTDLINLINKNLKWIGERNGDRETKRKSEELQAGFYM